ncbi:MAG TPA: hypothetical protein VGL71_02505, partial [Urbifossiella sp.]
MMFRFDHRIFVIGGIALLWCIAPVAADEPFKRSALSPFFESKSQPLPAKKTPPVAEKPTPAQLRECAARAEKAGDWETAFSAYCELPIVDRSAPEVREKVNASLRRVQQIRRHRDAGFQQFVKGLASADAVNLFAEVTAKVPGMFADGSKATPRQLWSHGVEELDRALASPAFRQTFLDNSQAAKIEAFRTSLRSHWSKRTIVDSREARTALKQLLAAAQDQFTVRVPAVLAIEFICGACSGLDEYTVFLNPAQLAEAP